jgi:hypothetical protein
MFGYFKNLKKKFRGSFGESMTSALSKIALGDEYTVIKGVIIPDGNEGTTQIDQVILSPYGIFVIEVKNMTGWIFGKEHDKKWTQSFRGGKKYSFQNPLHQNYKHIICLSDLLEIPKEHFFNIVVFGPDATLKTELPENVTGGKKRRKGFIPLIKEQDETIIDSAMLLKADAILKQFNETGFSKKLHKNYLKNRKLSNKPNPSKKYETTRKESNAKRTSSAKQLVSIQTRAKQLNITKKELEQRLLDHQMLERHPKGYLTPTKSGRDYGLQTRKGKYGFFLLIPGDEE